MFDNFGKTDLELMVGRDERILWQGRPNKRCFILESIFNPMMPFALIWLLFDSFFLFATLYFPSGEGASEAPPKAFILVFLSIHMMPVWIYLTGILFSARKYKHTEYIVTDKGVYISRGMFSYSCIMKPYTDIKRVDIHKGFVDQIIGVGDVVLTTYNPSHDEDGRIRVNGKPMGNPATSIEDIKDYRNVFEIIRRQQEDEQFKAEGESRS